jgi:type IV conjugative transfer system protein TraE
MKTAIQKSRFQQIIEQRNGYLVLSAGLLLLCILLSSTIFHLVDRERIIISPPVVHSSFWIDHDEVSPAYLSEMSSFFVQLKLTKTPSNAEFQRETLLRYTDPSFYGAFKNELVAEDEHMTNAHINLVFYPVNMVVDIKKLTASVTGDLQSTVGASALAPVRISYLISYRYDQGRLLLTSFKEEKKQHA